MILLLAPKIKFHKDKVCYTYQMGKQTKTSYEPKNHISTSRPLTQTYLDPLELVV